MTRFCMTFQNLLTGCICVVRASSLHTQGLPITARMDPSSSPSSSTSSRAQPSRDYLIDLIYLAPTTHPLTEDRIIVFSLAALSDVSEDVTDDELFSGLMDRCETWVNGDGDDVNSRKDGSKGYVLVILASEGEQGARSRGRGFRIWRWRSIPRR